MKFDPYLPDKVKSPKLFEVEDQINPVLQLYDEPTERRKKNFDGPLDGQFLNIYVVQGSWALMTASIFFYKF